MSDTNSSTTMSNENKNENKFTYSETKMQAELEEEPEESEQMEEKEEPEDALNKVLVHIAQKCIANNWFRHGNEFHEFTKKDIKEFKAIAPGWDYIEGGYTFLDEDGVPEGMIRIYSGNPKWSFWMEDGKIVVDWA